MLSLTTTMPEQGYERDFWGGSEDLEGSKKAGLLSRWARRAFGGQVSECDVSRSEGHDNMRSNQVKHSLTCLPLLWSSISPFPVKADFYTRSTRTDAIPLVSELVVVPFPLLVPHILNRNDSFPTHLTSVNQILFLVHPRRESDPHFDPSTPTRRPRPVDARTRPDPL